ncbi:MAG TPA: thioredoxin-dependent thiol peroxidase [Terriglobia bacterium]|nr:thioredoxin-dependent thiol peroxidase [Terriglobia bacterium]
MNVGQKAPAFTALDDSGKQVKLSDYKGRKVVLYFYPKDDTPGCTREACSFRDGISAISRLGAVVLGVSVDSVASHKKFKEKYQLNFPLISDAEKKIVEDYETWKEKTNYGKKYMGIERTTYIIGEDGKITHIFPRVKVDQHYEEVVEALKGA